MNAVVPLNLTPEASDLSAEESRTWFVVTQVKANRVVYFTDDPAYQPPMEGDWYFVSQHVGNMPPGMTLQNCWGWRFNGGVFSDVREAEPLPTLQRLLENNRQALLRLLQEKVNKARQKWQSSCEFGGEIRQRKLAQAKAFIVGRATMTEDFDLLHAVAAARGMEVAEAAHLIVQQDGAMWMALETTEAVRERLDVAIREARSNDALVALRRELLEDAWPESSQKFSFPAVVTEPSDLSAPLSDLHRVHEVARLSIQLRQIINARRSAVHRAYVGDETMLRHKARLAQAVLNKEEAGMDLRLLENMAHAHRLSSSDAARLILGSMSEAEQILVSTELTKDRLLAEIESIVNLRDVRRLGATLDALSHNHQDITP